MIKEYIELDRQAPEALLTCEEEPPAPDDDSTEFEFWDRIMEIIDSGRDCRAKLAYVRGLARKSAPALPPR